MPTLTMNNLYKILPTDISTASSPLDLENSINEVDKNNDKKRTVTDDIIDGVKDFAKQQATESLGAKAANKAGLHGVAKAIPVIGVIVDIFTPSEAE